MSSLTKQWSENVQHNFSVFYKQWADSTVREGCFKWKQTTRPMLQKISDWIMFWTITVTLTFNKTIQSLCMTLQLSMMYHQAKFGCEWSSFENIAEVVTFLLHGPSLWSWHWLSKIAKPSFMLMQYHTSLIMKCWFFFFNKLDNTLREKWLHAFFKFHFYQSMGHMMPL